jgi:hypothetical protein
MAFLPRYARAVDWNLSGAKSGLEIGKMLSTAQSVAKLESSLCFKGLKRDDFSVGKFICMIAFST